MTNINTEGLPKISCSISILTFNNGGTLRKCLETAVDFSEIIICDGGSTDDTLDIAKEFGCKIVQQDAKYKYDNNKIADFSGVRNQTYEATTNKWFFYVDSDEYLSKEVVEEIRGIVENGTEDSPKVYKTPRKFTIDGEIIDCAAVYPNYHIRLFHKDFVSGFRKKVHEKPMIKEGVKMGKLVNVTYVPTETDYEKIKIKQDYYLNIERVRHEDTPVKNLFLGLYNSVRATLVRVLKLTKVYLVCRGKKLPLKKDFYAIRYNLSLGVVFCKLIFKSILR